MLQGVGVIGAAGKHGRGMDWRKSSHSGANGGSCVEVTGAARFVLVRDTTDRDGRTLAFTAEAWRAFAQELKRRLATGTTGTLIRRRLARYRPLTAASSRVSRVSRVSGPSARISGQGHPARRPGRRSARTGGGDVAHGIAAAAGTGREVRACGGGVMGRCPIPIRVSRDRRALFGP